MVLAPIAMGAFVIVPCQAQTLSAGVGVDATVGATSNPFLLQRDDPASSYAQISISPQVALVDGRTVVVLDANYRRTGYLRLYNGSDAYSGILRASGELTERLNVRSVLQYTSSIAGEATLSSAPGDSASTVPANQRPPIDSTDVSVLGTASRLNNWNIASGVDWKKSERDFVSLEASASRTSYSNGALTGSHGITVSTNYTRALSARVSVGVALDGQWQSFDTPGSKGTVYQPQLTLVSQLAPHWSLKGALGMLFVNSRAGGIEENSIGLSGDAYLCHDGEDGRLCLRGYRDAEASGLGAISKRLGFSLAYTHRFDEKDFLQTSASYTKLSQSTLILSNGADSYGDAEVNFEHRFSSGLSAGTNVVYRKSFGGSLGGRDDLNASLFIRSRFGKFR